MNRHVHTNMVFETAPDQINLIQNLRYHRRSLLRPSQTNSSHKSISRSLPPKHHPVLSFWKTVWKPVGPAYWSVAAQLSNTLTLPACTLWRSFKEVVVVAKQMKKLLHPKFVSRAILCGMESMLPIQCLSSLLEPCKAKASPFGPKLLVQRTRERAKQSLIYKSGK